ncbi:MAG TPA: POTRA domain-containing protein [Rhodocyclaceae bacterium]|nr:POTRA domain-containing protein [Rhodocyclaceae bacterium]
MPQPQPPQKKNPASLAHLVAIALLPVTVGYAPLPALAQGASPAIPLQNLPAKRAAIQFFEIRGVTSLSAEEVRGATARYVGYEYSSSNIRKAIEAIEALYRARGKAAAQVFLAGEDKARGAVVIEIVEAPAAGSPPAADATAPVASENFVIERFAVRGAHTLGAEQIQAATARHTGADKNFGDIQQAIDAIEELYRSRGFGAVQVLLPEQDISRGTVQIEVVETPIGQITVKGNLNYSADNVRRSIPALQEGATPNAKAISQNVQLANENQGKQVEVILAVGARDNTVDARIEVKEDRARRIFVTADNTGTEPTGEYRVGIGYLHNNLFDRDHSAALAYTTAVDAPSSVDINVFSVAYRIPFYGIGDSLTLLYGYSDVSTPTAQTTGFAINGKGNLAALRWSFYLPRQGEFSSQILAGIDWKEIKSSCKDVNGVAVTGTAGCIDYTTLPLSLTYTGRKDSIGSQYDYSLGASYNIPSGESYAYSTTASDRYTLAAGNRQADDDFYLLRLAGSYTAAFYDWLTRAAITGQYTHDSALVSSEQIGLAGAQAVRGFLDRIVVADSGAVINLEAYSPDLAPLLGLPEHNLRALAFVDYAYGRDNHSSGVPVKELGSWGLGLRYQYRKDVSFKLDAASIVLAEPEGVYRGSDPAGGVLDQNEKNDWRFHGSVMLSF